MGARRKAGFLMNEINIVGFPGSRCTCISCLNMPIPEYPELPDEMGWGSEPPIIEWCEL